MPDGRRRHAKATPRLVGGTQTQQHRLNRAPACRKAADQILELGLRASRALDCRGVTRVDFRLDPEDRPWCLEVNTIPGMTPTSLVPMAAKAAGLTYEQVVQRMLDLALEEARRRRMTVPTKA